MVRIRQTVSIYLVFACCVCTLFTFLLPALAEDSIMDAWVWNTESYRVMLYEAPSLTNANRFYSPYLLNGFPVRILAWSDDEKSVCVSLLEHIFWIDSKYICISPPESTGCPVTRITTEEISLSSPNEGTIPAGTRVDIRGYTGKSVIINYNGEILEVHPASIQLREITYDAPEYLLSQADIIPLCKQELMNVYGLSASSIEPMRIEFVSYSTIRSPALYIVRFYTEVGEIYTLHCDGEYGIVIDSHFSPYAVG